MKSLSYESRRSQYRILGLVGHGQFGRVFCAVHEDTGRLVALKHLGPQFPTRQFLRELRFLLSLQHPNIVTCQAIEHTTSGRYLVMDYCEGGTLRSLLPPTLQLSALQAVQLVCDILAGLEHAHSRGVVHCDIKPENTLLAIAPAGWTARISDFGIARLSQELSQQDSGQTGSPAYMAPERFFNQYSSRSDLYSVGVILFELLTGERPFSGTPMELMSAHLNRPIILPDIIPPALQPVIQTALQKIPARRFSSAAQMQAALLAAVTQMHDDRRPSLQQLGQLTLPPQPLSERIECLVGNKVCRYWITSTSSDVILHRSEGTAVTHFPLSASVGVNDQLRCTLLLRPQGCFVLTETGLYLQPTESAVEMQQIAAIEPQTQVAIAPNGRWFAAVSPSAITIRSWRADGVVQILHRWGESGVCEAIALDTRHFAIITPSIATNSTQIEVWTRQGQRMACFNFAATVSQVTSTLTRDRLLAIDRQQPNCLLLVEIQPFRVQRIELAIEPCWITAINGGYACIDSQGHIITLNNEGQLLEHFHIPQVPTAVAMIDSRLEIATWTAEDRGRLYSVNLSHNLFADR